MTEEQWKEYPARFAEELDKYQVAIQADYFLARKPLPQI